MKRITNNLRDFGIGIYEGITFTPKLIGNVYFGVPKELPSTKSKGTISESIGRTLGTLGVFSVVTASIVFGTTKGMDAWINYNEPPIERTVYHEEGRPSYEVVTEEPGAQSITNWYSGQKIVGPMPIRRGPKAEVSSRMFHTNLSSNQTPKVNNNGPSTYF